MIKNAEFYAALLAIVGSVLLCPAFPLHEARAAAMSEPLDNAPLPAGAIKIGDDQYMVPLGKDSDGCEQFRMHSQRSGVPAVIFYRDAKGGFTMNRLEADCRPSR